MWALFTLLGLVACIVLILCIPLDFAFYCNTKTSPKIGMHLNWLLGLVKYRLRPGQKVKGTKKKGTTKEPVKKDAFNFKTWISILKTRGLAARLIKLIRDIYKALRIKDLRAKLSIGMEDPVDYGYFFSLCIPLNYLLTRTSHDVSIEPVYEGQYIFDLESTGKIRIFPIQLLVSLLVFIISIPVIKILGIWIKSKWKLKS